MNDIQPLVGSSFITSIYFSNEKGPKMAEFLGSDWTTNCIRYATPICEYGPVRKQETNNVKITDQTIYPASIPPTSPLPGKRFGCVKINQDGRPPRVDDETFMTAEGCWEENWDTIDRALREFEQSGNA